MIDIVRSETFRKWAARLRDHRAQALIAERLLRLSLGNPGDIVAVGDGVYEMRIHSGPGYRLYYCYHGKAMVILLCGGDKSTQRRDIQQARGLAREWRSSHV